MGYLNQMEEYLEDLSPDSDKSLGNFRISNSKDSIVIGKSEYGNIAFNKKAVQFGLVRCLTAGTTGSGKSYTTRAMIEAFLENDEFSNVIIDPEGEYYTLREKYDLVLAGAEADECDLVIEETLEDQEGISFSYTVSAEKLGEKIATNRMNVIIDLARLDEEVQQDVANKILRSILKHKKSKERKGIIPTNIFIEEASIFAKTGAKADISKKCKDVLKTLSKRGRKYAICTFFNTQRFTQLHNDIKSECDTKIIGHFYEMNDIERCKPYLGVKRFNDAKKMIDSLYKYKFFAIGNSFDHSSEMNRPIQFKSVKVKTRHPQILDREPGYIPPRSEKVEQWMMEILDKAYTRKEEKVVESPKVSEKEESNLVENIVKYFGSLSFIDLHMLTKRDDYSLVDTSIEYHCLFSNNDDFQIDDNRVVYMGEDSIDPPIKSESLINFWRKHVNNPIMSNIIKYLWENINESNSIEEISDVLNVETHKLTQAVYEFDNLNIVKINEGHVWLNYLLLFDQDTSFEEEEEDFEDEDFEVDEF